MYNFIGVWRRMLFGNVLLLILYVLCVVFSSLAKKTIPTRKQKRRNEKIKQNDLGIWLILILVALMIPAEVIYMKTPKVSMYTGEFVKERRYSRSAMSFPSTYEYTFQHNDEHKKGFYLDLFSKKEVYPDDFEQGEEYVIWYEDFTKTIVKVEKVE